jgi:putative hydrolase of the HAD superfamily
MAQHIFFDFFGTLVSYSSSRREQGYEVSHRTLREAGAPQGYEEFLDLWCEVSDEFELKFASTHQEFSMSQVGSAFLQRALGMRPPAQLTERFVDAYLSEWNKGVHYLPGLRELLVRLSSRYDLAVITNTSDSPLIHAHLRQMGIDDLFEAVVTSVEYGFRKPHSGIFQHAMDLVGAVAEHSFYVGDTFEADYVGSASVGMRGFLIDPDRRHDVHPSARLENLFDLEGKLRALEI